jgi:hypothetical protein
MVSRVGWENSWYSFGGEVIAKQGNKETKGKERKCFIWFLRQILSFFQKTINSLKNKKPIKTY